MGPNFLSSSLLVARRPAQSAKSSTGAPLCSTRHWLETRPKLDQFSLLALVTLGRRDGAKFPEFIASRGSSEETPSKIGRSFSSPLGKFTTGKPVVSLRKWVTRDHRKVRKCVNYGCGSHSFSVLSCVSSSYTNRGTTT